MDYFAGLDVSVKETSVCIVDDAGKIVREARVASEPEALLQVLTNNFMSTAPNTTLADLFTLLFPANPSSAVRASLR
jgi:hypothetical protein